MTIILRPPPQLSRKSSNWLRSNKKQEAPFCHPMSLQLDPAWCDSFCWMGCGCADSYRAIYAGVLSRFSVVLWQGPRYIIIISSSSSTTVLTSSRRRESPRPVQMWEQHGAEVFITSSSSLLLQQVATLSSVKLEGLDGLQLSTLPSQLPVHGRRVYYANC